MAYGSNPGGGNPGGGEDYFSDGPKDAPQMEEKEEHAGGETGILPKTLMAGKDFKPGEEIVLKVVAVHENDFEVEYSHGDEKEESSGEHESAAAPPSGDMASLME